MCTEWKHPQDPLETAQVKMVDLHPFAQAWSSTLGKHPCPQNVRDLLDGLPNAGKEIRSQRQNSVGVRSCILFRHVANAMMVNKHMPVSFHPTQAMKQQDLLPLVILAASRHLNNSNCM